MIYANPGEAGSVVSFEKRYGNYIGGEFVPPVKGQYFDNKPGAVSQKDRRELGQAEDSACVQAAAGISRGCRWRA